MRLMFSCESPEGIEVRPPASYTVLGTRALPINAEGKLFWHLVNFSPDLEVYHQVSLIAKVFASYQQILYPWRFEPTSNPDQAEWKIYFANEDNKIVYNDRKRRQTVTVESPYNFKRASGTIAVQYEYFPGFPWSLSCIINDKYFYGLAHGGQTKDLFKVLLHEIGHGFRLGHTTAKGDIMYPTYDPDNDFTKDSLDGLWHIHGEHIGEYVDSLEPSRRFISRFGSKGSEVPSNGLSDKPGCLSFNMK